MTKVKTEYNQSETAKLFGVTITTIKNWRKQGCPVVDTGSRAVLFSIPDLYKWRIERETERIEELYNLGDARDYDDMYHKHRAEMAKQKARAEKRRNDIAEGELLFEVEVRDALRQAGLAYRMATEQIKRGRTDKDFKSGKDLEELMELFLGELNSRVEIKESIDGGKA